MPGSEPARQFKPLPFAGVLDESQSPKKIGAAGGLTAAQNLTYRRFGSWGKRLGSQTAYAASQQGPFATSPPSAYRWYASLPTPITQLVSVAQGGFYTANDPNTVSPSAMTLQATFSGIGGFPVCFAPARDPAANNGNGADILIITGVTGPYGFANYAIPLTTPYMTGDTAQIRYVFGATTVTTPIYTVLATDNAQTIAAALVVLVNQSAAVIAGTPFLGTAFAIQGGVYVGALVSGTAGNAITVQLLKNGSLLGTPASFAGGGATTGAPVKWDGTTLSGLSYQITQAFSGCVTWHNHVWFWGDPNNPEILYASDINQPEGFVFMNTQGGYPIGPGDGDTKIRSATPIGNILYVFKSDSIFAVSGYDFQSGEYAFQVAPALTGYGIPTSTCVTTLRNALVFWTGSKFMRLAVGSFEAEHLGMPIPLSEGRASVGNQYRVRAVAGDFQVNVPMPNSYLGTTNQSMETLSNIALFAVDVGNGAADTVLMYDDDATRAGGAYAWSVWTGWKVGSFVQNFGHGPRASGADSEPPLLLYMPPSTAGAAPSIVQYGSSNFDNGVAVPWLAQTGWMDLGTYALEKQLHRFWLDVESTPGTALAVTVIGSIFSTVAGPSVVYPKDPIVVPIVGGQSGNIESFQVLLSRVNPFLRANAYLFSITEPGSNSSFEVSGITVDYIEEAFKP